jgi:hypothetical protein
MLTKNWELRAMRRFPTVEGAVLRAPCPQVPITPKEVRMSKSAWLGGLLVTVVCAGCAEPSVAPTEEGHPPDLPSLVNTPTNFTVSACVVDSADPGTPGMYYAHKTFSWTASDGSTGVWQMDMGTTAGGGHAFFDYGSSGTTRVLQIWTADPGSVKNRWFYVRDSLDVGGWSSWVALTGSYTNVAGFGCFEE